MINRVALVLASFGVLVPLGAFAQQPPPLPPPTATQQPVAPLPATTQPPVAPPPGTSTATAQPGQPPAGSPPVAPAPTGAYVPGYPTPGPGAGPPPGYYPGSPGEPQPPPPPAPDAKKSKRIVSITFSPIHLILPMFELTAEFRLHENIGLAVIGGAGQTTISDPYKSYKFNLYEVGGQLLFYPISNFDDGLQLGIEALYAYVDTKDYSGSIKVTGAGDGMALGPLIGYKLATKGGFTFVAQGGAEFMVVRAKASDSAGNSSSADDREVIPLLNLNIGWSF